MNLEAFPADPGLPQLCGILAPEGVIAQPADERHPVSQPRQLAGNRRPAPPEAWPRLYWTRKERRPSRTRARAGPPDKINSSVSGDHDLDLAGLPLAGMAPWWR